MQIYGTPNNLSNNNADISPTEARIIDLENKVGVNLSSQTLKAQNSFVPVSILAGPSTPAIPIPLADVLVDSNNNPILDVDNQPKITGGQP